MWENERRNELIRNIVIGVILVLLTVGLVFGYLAVRKRIQEEDARLSDIHSDQRQELSDARQENKAQINMIYQKHLDVLAQYLPGIICWGDSLTNGSSGNVSYPHTLQKYLDVYIAGVYDLRYSLDSFEGLSIIDWDDYKISIPVVNMGAGRENSATILGRSGVLPYVVSENFTIPAETEGVTLEIVAEDDRSVTPLIAGDGGVNPVTIAGVQGTLTRVSGAQTWKPHTYQFTRLEAGTEIPVEKGTKIVTAVTDAYQDYIHIVWLGTYDNAVNPEKLVSDTKALLQRQNINTERYLVIGPCASNGTWSMSSTNILESIDSAMLQAFGDRYINLRKYLIEDGLRDAGVTATTQDKQSLAAGKIPNSFRSNTSGADLNGVAYELLGKLVYERMDRLGYFDEVRDALELEKTIEAVLKEEPKYFENRLNAY